MLQTASQFTANLIAPITDHPLRLCLSMFVMIGHQTLPPIGDRDEARFAQASSQMLQTGDFITVKFQDEYQAKSQLAFTGCNLYLLACLAVMILPIIVCHHWQVI